MSASLHPTQRARLLAWPPGDDRRDVPRVAFTVATLIAAFTWLPMLLLALAERIMLDRPGAVAAFARDATTHVRFLVAVPLLVLADVLVTTAFSRCEAHLSSGGFVTQEEQPRLRAGIARARALRDSRTIAIALATVVFGLAMIRRGHDTGDWVYLEARERSWASTWLGYVAFPAFRFLLLRFTVHWLVWSGFLLWVRSLDLRLIAAHPDRSAGLGFLTVPISAALGVVFGVSLTAAMAWRNALITHVATIGVIRGQSLLLAAVWLVVLLGPLVAFGPHMLRLKRVAVVEYSALGDRYTRAFHVKWLCGKPSTEPLLGTPDIQSLADLGHSMEVVHGLRPTPVEPSIVVPVVLTYAIAMLPVALAQISLDELIRQLLKVVL